VERWLLIGKNAEGNDCELFQNIVPDSTLRNSKNVKNFTILGVWPENQSWNLSWLRRAGHENFRLGLT
jgi:hypothetical protein